jgi:murein DD-endopeptidase MepM/ murein hydrolase activator NlpD
MKKLLIAILLAVGAFKPAFCEKLYLPYRYPGSLGYFKLKSSDKCRVIIGYRGKKWLFKGIKGEEKIYFAIPYQVRAPFSLSLIRGKERLFFKIISPKKKRYRLSKIWVKERPLTRKVLERIKRENRLLRRVLREVTPKKFSSGKLYPPLPKLRISTPFGAKRVINGKRHSIHWGTDFRARKGTPVRAVLGGKVVLARELYFTGKTVVIDHGLGIHTLYAHLSRITVKEGQLVKRGQLIGKVGSTGRSTGPHLHFGFYVQGVRADPMIVMKESL